jgi:hypothetical protein
MKTFIKFFAITLGAFFSALGISSCSSSDDDNTNECCTYSYVDGGNTYTYTACENGSYTYSINGQVVDDTPWTSESFGDGNTTWEQMKAAALAEGGTCN